MMKHFSDVSTTSLPFVQTPRIPRMDASAIHECQRFRSFGTGWGISWPSSRITFSVNKPVMLHGAQHFGSEGCSYTGSMEVKDTTDGSSLVKQSGSYVSEKDKTCSYHCFSVQFDHPVRLMENRKYKLESLIKGPMSCYGMEGQTSVECQGVVFSFHVSSADQWYNRSTQTMGQFPVLFWSASR